MNNELTVIATTYDISEAEFLRNHLEGEGYNVFLADEHIVSINNLLAPAIGGIKIKVPESQADKAKLLVENIRNAEIIWEDNPTDDREM